MFRLPMPNKPAAPVFLPAALLAALLALAPAMPAAAEDADARSLVVILDPGHGGDDPGVRAESLPAEKNLSLDLARELQKIFQRHPEWEIVLTRSQDKRLSISDRQELANRKPADVFVSLHMLMKADAPQAAPCAYFFYGRFVKDESLAAQAAREVAAGVHVIPWDLAQNSMVRQSRKMGNTLARGWEGSGPAAASAVGGLQQAPLLLLAGLHCPAVMVEIIWPVSERARTHGHAECVQAARALGVGLEAYLTGR